MNLLTNTLIDFSKLNEVNRFLDGKTAVVEGVEGTFELEVWIDRFGLQCQQLNHIPTDAGRESEAYQQIRRELGDDWSSDMTWSPLAVEIAVDLGFVMQKDGSR